MAKDGSNRGRRRVRAGVKPDPLNEKLATGRPATRRLYTGTPLGQTTIRKVSGYACVSTDHKDQVTSYQAQVDYYTRYITDHAG